MADNETTPNEGSPFTRPAFLVAAVLVLVIALLGAIVAVRAARSNDTAPTPSASVTTDVTPSDPVSTPAADASVCGLADGDQGELTTGPAATWKYQGTIAYPESPEQGPGKTSPEGYRYCFQHSPAGAVFAVANGVAQGSEPTEVSSAWADYFVGGSDRQRILDQIEAEPSSGTDGIRTKIVGFKVLAYTGSTARVDIASEISGQNQLVYASAVYELVWESGDWKLNSDIPTPFNFASIPSTAGYVPWGE